MAAHASPVATHTPPPGKAWSQPMVWLVWGLPLASILISGTMAVIAVKYQDPVLPHYNNSGEPEESAVPGPARRTTATIYPEQARNHAAHLVDAPEFKGRRKP